MWQTVWKIELRKTLPWFLGWLVIILVYALLRSAPFRSIDLMPVLLGAGLGATLAGRLFGDTRGTEAFVFSLPLSRARLFWYRWLLGLACQGLTLLALLGLLALGARQAVQTGLFRSPWYPMVRWYELSVLWPVGLGSLLAYQVVGYVMSRKRVLMVEQAALSLRWKRHVSVICAVGGFVAGFGMFIGTDGQTPARLPSLPLLPLLAYTIAVVLLTTLSSLHCYRRMEVPA